MKILGIEINRVKKPTHDEKGRELLDNTPIEVPAALRRPDTLQDEVRRLFRQLSQEAVAAGAESFEESFDFEEEEEDITDEQTPYQRGAALLEEEVPKYEQARREAEARAVRGTRDAVHGRSGSEIGGKRGETSDGSRENPDGDGESDRRGKADVRGRAADGNRGVQKHRTADQDDSEYNE